MDGHAYGFISFISQGHVIPSRELSDIPVAK